MYAMIIKIVVSPQAFFLENSLKFRGPVSSKLLCNYVQNFQQIFRYRLELSSGIGEKKWMDFLYVIVNCV